MSNFIRNLTNCKACPRECQVNREQGETGYCFSTKQIKIGSICIHKGEEPLLSGSLGMGNIFFNHCNLQCIYCQNHQISRNDHKALTIYTDLKEVIIAIEKILSQGVKILGLVSPSHRLYQAQTIIQALHQHGHEPTIVLNTNAYDKVENLIKLKEDVQVYLPDLKYSDNKLAWELSGADNYVAVAQAALKEMFGQKGTEIATDEQGIIKSGLIIRHLVLPGYVENSKQCLRFIARELSPQVHISLMSQYTPTPAVRHHPYLSRKLSVAEYEEVLEEMEKLGLDKGWVQELSSAGHYQPDFALEHPFEDE